MDDQAVFAFRINQIRGHLRKQRLDAALITSVPQLIYLTDYAGFSAEERDAYILISQTDAYIFTNALYIEEIRQQVTHMKVVELNRNNLFFDALKKLLHKDSLKTVGIEENNLSVREFQQLTHLSISIKPIDLTPLREIKNVQEIAAIKKACNIGDKAFSYIVKKIKAGMTEKEVAYELEFFIRKQHAYPSFRSIVAFGANAAVPHHLSNNSTLQTNSCVLLDFGVNVDNYCSDMTRTIFIGSTTSHQKLLYQTVLASQHAAISFLKDKLAQQQKITGAEVDQVARDYIAKKGFPSFQHSLGHGIGIEIHEAPRLSPLSKDLLLPGMVFSIEPGIYLLGEMGVRIEDLFVIQNNTLVQLTKSSQELIEIH